MASLGRYKSLVLASASPRRAGLLRQVTAIPFSIIKADVDEDIFFEKLPPQEAVVKASIEKAVFAAGLFRSSLIIAADTVIVCDGTIMRKPSDISEAREMLIGLRSRVHTVLTGLSVIGRRGISSDIVATEVEMRSFSDTELDLYLASGEPFDKAGAYAIQGRGALLVKRVCGCYYNIVGLPLARLEEMLLENEVTLLRNDL
ncbi:MAG: Maf family protein [bacterium]|jgi:septum formation protein|nr:Maf family protein [bacterium]MDD3806312.1 Maf family protein [bacterium]MDD4558541.1 Maf family protein [bacterium]